MKYIRTKNGRIGKVISVRDYNGPKPLVFYANISGEIYSNFELGDVQFADTIEELCDGFWWENEMYKEPIFIPNYLIALDRIDAWKESDKELKSNSLDRITIFGSIYIKGKGWFHIAKMNDKGELELC